MKKLIIKGMGVRYFSNKIVKWYLQNSRPLPWRQTRDPYRIWLSEVILQQTRVAQGMPYYQRFIEQYPAIDRLAAASEQEVLRLWQGLGYYTRARNLHKCARYVTEVSNGIFPATYDGLKKLPGIGEYTAAAIASFAFKEPVAVVDGNVFRILSRVFGISTPINSPAGRTEFSQLANELLSRRQPDLHNQAIMEFGALMCRPKNPQCSECPFQSDCTAFRGGLVQQLPVKVPSKKSRKRYFYYLVVEKDQSLLMRRRNEKDIWEGLFDFVLIEKDRPARPERIFGDQEYRKWFRRTDTVSVSPTYKHTLTHQEIHCRFIRLKADAAYRLPDSSLSFYSAQEVAELPKPVLINRFLADQKSTLV